MVDQIALISLLKGGGAPAPLHWNALLDQAVREGVFYPLYRALDEGRILIPDEFRDRFRQTYYLNLSRGAEFSSAVERVLDRIESSGTSVLLFKGPSVDRLIYDGFFRPRLDLDICVMEEHAAVLEKALAALGYAPQTRDKDYPLPEYRNSRLFTSSECPAAVHVHSHLFNNMFLSVDGAWSIDMGKVWEETESFGSCRHVRVLKPELNIVYLCEHGLKHDFDQLIFLYEIERLVSRYGGDFDWEKLTALARAFGLSQIVYHGLYLADTLLSAGIPPRILADLRPARLTAGEKMFIRDTLAGELAAIEAAISKLGPAPGGGVPDTEALQRLSEELGALSRQEAEGVGLPAKQIADVAGLVVAADSFVKLAQRQAALARML